MKAMVPQLPFHCLPMGYSLEHALSHESYTILQDILDGIDILLYEKICKLGVLDLHYKILKFWTQWCDNRCQYCGLFKIQQNGK